MGHNWNMGLLVVYTVIFMVTIDNINAGGSTCIEDNVAMPGNDIIETSPEGIKTKEECCIACKNKEGCKFFTYRKEKEKCWLKNSDAGRKVDEEAVSGSVDCCKVFACYEWTTEQLAQLASLSFPEKKKICEDQGPEYKYSQGDEKLAPGCGSCYCCKAT